MLVCSGEERDDDAAPADCICAICLHLPAGRVDQCANGHAFCAACLARCRTCPTCRIRLPATPIRCLVAERWIAAARGPARCAFARGGLDTLTDLGAVAVASASVLARWLPAGGVRAGPPPARGGDEVELEVESPPTRRMRRELDAHREQVDAFREQVDAHRERAELRRAALDGTISRIRTAIDAAARTGGAGGQALPPTESETVPAPAPARARADSDSSEDRQRRTWARPVWARRVRRPGPPANADASSSSSESSGPDAHEPNYI